MKKYVLDLKVVSVEALSDKHVLIKLTDEKSLPEILPGSKGRPFAYHHASSSYLHQFRGS